MFQPLSINSPRSVNVPSPLLSGSSKSSSPVPNRPSTSQAQAQAAKAPLTNTPRLGLGLVNTRPWLPGREENAVVVTSPHELTQYVDNLLDDLEARFDHMSTDVLSRLSALSTRIDSLESSISELLSGNAGGPVHGDQLDAQSMMRNTSTQSKSSTQSWMSTTKSQSP